MPVEEMVDTPTEPSAISRASAAPTAGRSPARAGRVRGLLRKPFVVMPIATLLVVALLWWFFGRADGGTESTGAPEQVVTVSRGAMNETVSADGTVEAAQTDDLSFAAAGTVTEVNVKAGDAVAAGQVLARIDSAELEAAVASASSDLADAQAKLADDQDAGASDEQISADETSVTAGEDSVANAEEDLAGASLVASFDGTVASVDLTVGEVLGSGGTGSSDLTGSASGSGGSSSALGSGSTQGPAIGGAAPDDSSADASSSTPQIQVVSTGRYTVEVSVDTNDIDSIEVGQVATITVSSGSSGSGFLFGGGGGFPRGGGFPDFGGNAGGDGGGGSQGQGSEESTSSDAASATGTVTSVSTVADASSGVASYPVTITFDAGSREFFVGSTVTGEITTTARENVLQVSSLAVTTSNGQSTVEVARNGTADGPTETRTVRTGLTSGGMTEITSGLEEGESVVITLRVPGAGNGGNLPDFGSGGGFPGGLGGGPGTNG